MKYFIKIGLSFMALLLVFSIYSGGKPAKASELELTQEKKEELYNQYVEIVAEVAAQYPDKKIYINPLNTFKDEYFMEPEDYKEFIVDLATSHVVVEPDVVKTEKLGNITPFTTGTATKKVNIVFGTSTRTINVTGSFSIDNFLGRMGFVGIKSITSKAADTNRGTWSQKGYNGKILDMGETYDVSITGDYTENGSTIEHSFTVYYYCSGTGNVS